MITRISILFILFNSCLPAFSQKRKADSLAVLVTKAKTDTSRINLLWKLADACSYYNPDTALQVAQRGLFLSQQIGYIEGESRTLGIMANTFMRMGNYPQALNFNIKKLKLEEQRDKPANLASVLMNIGAVYALQDQLPEALKYYKKSDSVIHARNVASLKYNSYVNLGDAYYRLKMPDSAYLYFEHSLDLARELNEPQFIGASQTGMAHVQLLRGNYPASLSGYREAMAQLQMANDNELLCEASLGLAGLYRQLVNPDSSVFYARFALATAQKSGFLSRELDAARFLSEHYKTKSRYDSAFFYTTLVQMVNDTLNSKSRIREAQSMSISEQLRQTEMEEAKRVARKTRNQQLQLLFIAIFIPGFFLITLLFSRIQIHRRVVVISGILSLLILFEFLTLLLHPFVEKITGHRPILEILIFVSVAAVLIPAHHRLEHWMLHKLTRIKPGESPIKIKQKKLSMKIKKDETGG